MKKDLTEYWKCRSPFISALDSMSQAINPMQVCYKLLVYFTLSVSYYIGQS